MMTWDSRGPRQPVLYLREVKGPLSEDQRSVRLAHHFM